MFLFQNRCVSPDNSDATMVPASTLRDDATVILIVAIVKTKSGVPNVSLFRIRLTVLLHASTSVDSLDSYEKNASCMQFARIEGEKRKHAACIVILC